MSFSPPARSPAGMDCSGGSCSIDSLLPSSAPTSSAPGSRRASVEPSSAPSSAPPSAPNSRPSSPPSQYVSASTSKYHSASTGLSPAQTSSKSTIIPVKIPKRKNKNASRSTPTVTTEQKVETTSDNVNGVTTTTTKIIITVVEKEVVAPKKPHKLSRQDLSCGGCGFPAVPPPRPRPGLMPSSADALLQAHCEPRTEMEIVGVGRVPVTKGDPKILPRKVQLFIAEKTRLMRPSDIYICNGSVFEEAELQKQLVKKGVLEPLRAYSNVHLARSDPLDAGGVLRHVVVHTEKNEVEASHNGPLESEFAHWMMPACLTQELDQRFIGCMRGRTLFVVPLSLGPISGRHSLNAIVLTDSPIAVLQLRMMTRVSSSVWDSMGTGPFLRAVHSVGQKRPAIGLMHRNWPCNPHKSIVAHCLEERLVWQFGTGLFDLDSLSLRLTAYMARKEGWTVQHAAIISITDGAGKEWFILAQLPSGGGKSALATMTPALPGWKVRVIGDDVAWIRFHDGRMYAMNPLNGMNARLAGVAEGSGLMKMVSKNSVVVNAASTGKGRFHWTGLAGREKETLTDWRGHKHTPYSDDPSHPDARFTAFLDSCPNVHEQWDSPKGHPIDAYILGCRREDGFPLVLQAEDWHSASLIGASLRSEHGPDLPLVADPFSMRGQISYNFGHFINHWIHLNKRDRKMPPVFFVNWHRRTPKGEQWPGFGDNIRVLKWILQRVDGTVIGKRTAVGTVPVSLDTTNLHSSFTSSLPRLLTVERDFWKAELKEAGRFLDRELGINIPSKLKEQLKTMKTDVSKMDK